MFATVWAEVKGISGRERMTAGAETAQATVRVWIRFRVDVTASSRIRVLTGAYSGNELDIVGPPVPDGKRTRLEILCKTGAPRMTAELITLEEVKLHCRIDGNEEDQLISGYIAAALEVCQKHIGRRFDDGLEFTASHKDWLHDVRVATVRIQGHGRGWRHKRNPAGCRDALVGLS
ncbi:putative head-tail adaptor [Escherichia coli]|nr:putative head-tail adaptor [Escherichia coli]